MGAFESIVQTMIEMDILQLFFPWLLITAVTYGALNKYDVFEEESVLGAVSVSVAFISLAGIYLFVPSGMFANFGAAIAFGIFGILGLTMFLGMSGVDVSDFEGISGNPLAGIGIVIVITAFIGVLSAQMDLAGLVGDVDTSGSSVLMQILTLVFIVVIVAVISRD